MNYTITVHPYQKKMGRNDGEHNSWKTAIINSVQSILPIVEGLENFEVFNLQGQYKDMLHGSGSEKRLVVFGNNTQGVDEPEYTIEEGLSINGVENDIKRFLKPNGSGLIILSEHNIPIAEYFEASNGLNILFDLFGIYTEKRVAMFSYIVKELDRLVFQKRRYDKSWKHTSRKEQLTESLTKAMKAQKERRLVEDKERVTNWIRKVDDYKREIKILTDKIINTGNSIEREEQLVVDMQKSVISELDKIVANPLVMDLYIDNGKYIVHTVPLYAYDKNGLKYYMGNYRIELMPENADIRFFGGTPRRGHWTSQDPHPHVNGEDGQACLGNTAPIIAELSSQYELYALVMTGIAFLEAVNIDDVAGRRVVNWDRVNEDGTPYVEPQQQIATYTCNCCDDEVADIHDAYDEVYEEVDENENLRIVTVRQHGVCEECLENAYHTVTLQGTEYYEADEV